MENITSQDIFDFYGVTLLYQVGKFFLQEEDLFLMNEYLEKIKSKYLENLRLILIDQIKKYIKRGRIDNIEEFKGDISSASISLLQHLMSHTYRSDMQRRNANWDFLAKHLNDLEKSQTIDKIIYNIDRLNNAIHNTHELTLTKLHNGYEIVNSLNFCHEATLEQIKNLVSSPLRKISAWRNLEKKPIVSFNTWYCKS